MYKFFIFLLLFPVTLLGQDRLQVPIEFQISKPYCLFNFMQTIAKEHNTSATLYDYFSDSPLVNDRRIQGLINSWQRLDLGMQYEVHKVPPRRKGFREIKEHLTMFAARADNLDEFADWTMGLIPNSTHQQMVAILRSVEPFYNQLIWDPMLPQFLAKKEQLEDYANEKDLSDYLEVVRNFYQSEWPNNVPFLVTLYPIPGETGHSISLARSNTLLCGTLLDNNDLDGLLGVVIHEISHILYMEQPVATQWEQFEWFSQSDSPYSDFAYSYLNEALATAIGNGWIYEKLHGSIDEQDWYADSYINGFARAMYPRLKDYLESERGFDQSLAEELIQIFALRFPQAIYEYQNLFNDFHLFSDIGDSKIETLIQAIQANFRYSSYYISTPILADQTMAKVEQVSTTRIFVITQRTRQTLGRLEASIPEMKRYKVIFPDRPFLYRFIDDKGKAVIIIAPGNDLEYLESAFTFLEEEKNLDANKPIVWLDD